MHLTPGIIASSISTASFFKKGTYTGNATNRSFTGFGFGTNQLNLIKRTTSAGDFSLQDSVRGTGVALATNGANPEATGLTTRVTSFDADGVSIGTSSTVNANTQAFAYWAWKKVANYLDIVLYNGSGIAQAVNHSLGVAPAMMLLKNRSNATGNWVMYHQNMNNSTTPQNRAEVWAAAGATATVSAGYFNNTAPSSTQFTVGINSDVNGLLDTQVAFLFGVVAGSSAFGSYAGNGSASGPSVTGLGFTPSVVIIVQDAASASKVWLVYGNNLNTSIDQAAATDTSNYVDLNSGGFQIKTTDGGFNTDTVRYLYAAFR
jgi:hypothetical protein